MAAPFPVSAPQAAFCGESCRLLYKEMGFETALSYLFAYLKQYYPLSRIFCGFRHYKSTLFVPVADTLGSQTNPVMTLATSTLTREQISVLMGTDAFEPYLMRASPFPDRSQMMLRQEDFACYLRVPLFSQDESIFQMAFCSHEPQAFNEEDGDLFFQITRPLGEAMSRDFSGQEPPQLGSFLARERRELLFMCQGLTELWHEVHRVAPTNCTVLVHGPTGAGKEVLVDALHACSSRSSGPFIKVNCGAIADSLLESELFGHEKGAFTGAHQGRAGFFEAANGGTLFLDEIGELPPRMQVGLLRVLDTHEVTRVGGTRSIPLNVRILAATHRNLRRLVEEGRFREDLWYRLNVYTLRIPPLCEHREDIPVLTHFFVNRLVRDMHLTYPPHITSKQMKLLCEYTWPGNIRELRHVVERTVLRARQGTACGPLNFAVVLAEMESLHRGTTPFPGASGVPSLPTTLPSLLPEGAPRLSETGPLPTLEQWTNTYVHWILQKTGGKITGSRGAAAILKVHPNTLRARRDRATRMPLAPESGTPTHD